MLVRNEGPVAASQEVPGRTRSTVMPADPPVMQAVIQDGYGAPERVLRLAETAVPPAGAGDVLVRVRAASVNTPDWATVAGAPYIMRRLRAVRRRAGGSARQEA